MYIYIYMCLTSMIFVCAGLYADNDVSIYTHMHAHFNIVSNYIQHIMARRNGSDCSAANHVLFA